MYRKSGKRDRGISPREKEKNQRREEGSSQKKETRCRKRKGSSPRTQMLKLEREEMAHERGEKSKNPKEQAYVN